MITIEVVESVSLVSMWMLDPNLPGLLTELGRRGYVVARVRPRSLGGYDITPLEANILAIRGSTRISYNPHRRVLMVEGSNIPELLSVFDEVEGVLRNVGSDPLRGILFYELQAKARAVGGRLTLKQSIRAKELIGFDLLAVPVSFVSADGDPNSTRWFHLDVRPLWTSWSSDKVRYEIVLVYRDEKEKLLSTLKSLDKILANILEGIEGALNTPQRGGGGAARVQHAARGG